MMLRINLFSKILFLILLSLYFVVVATPFLLMFFNGFKTTRELFLKPFEMPYSFAPENHIRAWERAGLGTAFLNSIVVSGAGILGVLFTSSMLAYVLSRYRFRFRRFIYVYIILGLALPARLAIIPIFLLLNSLKLTDTRLGLVLVYIATGASFATFLLKNFMDGIPLEIEESARMDGASPWTVYRRIALPLIKPALVVVGLVNFVNIWNDFFFPFIIITSKAKETVPLAVSLFYGEYSNQWPMIAAALTISVVPIMVVFFLFSKQFISGITQGAIK